MKSFDEVFVDCTKHGTKIKTDEYREKGKYVIIDQGQAEIAGYTDLEDGIFTDVPAIIFGDHTRVIKYIDAPFFLGADGVKVLKSKLKNANYKYLYYALQNAEIPNTGYNRHFKWLKETKIKYPDAEIQLEIVSTLDTLQSIITHRRTQLEKLDELIKARFVEMFGEPVSNPMGWEMCSIGDVVETIEAGWSGNGKQRPKKESEIAVLKVSAVTKGYFIPEEYKVLDDQINIKKYVYPHRGDLLFSRANTREMVGATAIIESDYTDLILPDKLWRICFKSGINVYYMKYILSSKMVRNEFSEASTGTSGSMFNVSMDKFKAVKIPMPSILHQTQFADFVKQIDKSKVAVQKSLDETQMLFDSLMQEYFG